MVCSKIADGSNLHSLWLPEVNGAEAFTTLGYLASHTSKVRLGSAITNIYTRTPSLVAMEAATLDWLSGGRAIIGLGSSTRRVVEDWHGLEFDRPLERMREFVDIVRLGLKGSKVNYDGKFFRISNFKLALGPIRSSVPILLAALNTRMVRLSAEISDGILLNLHPLSSLEKTMNTVELVRRKMPPGNFLKVAVLMVDFAPSKKVSEEMVKRSIVYYAAANGPYATMLRKAGFGTSLRRVQRGFKEGGMKTASHEVDEELLTDLPVARDIEELTTKVRALERKGMDVITLQPHFEDVNPEKTLKEALSSIIS